MVRGKEEFTKRRKLKKNNKSNIVHTPSRTRLGTKHLRHTIKKQFTKDYHLLSFMYVNERMAKSKGPYQPFEELHSIIFTVISKKAKLIIGQIV